MIAWWQDISNKDGLLPTISISGSVSEEFYQLYHSYQAPDPKDKGVVEFFQKLGYQVDQDSSRRLMEFWYDISDENGPIVQIDQGVPLDDIIMDIVQLHQGKEGISKSDYKLTGPPSAEMDLLFKRVHDFKIYGIMPDGQQTLAL